MADKRGNTFAALSTCIRCWLLKIVKPNAAERHKQYMRMQICMPKRGVLVEQFIERILQLNEFTKYLPCLKDQEGALSALERVDTPFTEL